jgi:hypothetical protein
MFRQIVFQQIMFQQKLASLFSRRDTRTGALIEYVSNTVLLSKFSGSCSPDSEAGECNEGPCYVILLHEVHLCTLLPTTSSVPKCVWASALACSQHLRVPLSPRKFWTCLDYPVPKLWMAGKKGFHILRRNLLYREASSERTGIRKGTLNLHDVLKFLSCLSDSGRRESSPNNEF